MSTTPQARQPEGYLDAPLVRQVRVAGDVVEVGPHTWAIHGVIPVDGDVIIGAFESPEAARAALDRLTVADDTTL